MWQCMYGMGYALIANAKFCKQYTIISIWAKIYIEISYVDLVWKSVQIHM